MPLQNWDEIRTAYQVARLGTVSAAAVALGVHHATVIRHVDALEARLGTKLFQRHARGYTPTEAGHDLLSVGRATEDQLNQLEGRIRGRGAAVTGELIVTALESFSPLLAPVLVDFQEQHLDLIVRLVTDDRVLRLEYGEAHVALRAGNRPQEPDNVVQPLPRQAVALYAHERYIARHGMIASEADLAGHHFVGPDTVRLRAPFHVWLQARVPAGCIRYRATNIRAQFDAVLAGAGVGFLPVWLARQHGEMVEVLAAREEWSPPIWLVTHVDLHRSSKVQTFLTFLKAAASAWPRVGDKAAHPQGETPS